MSKGSNTLKVLGKVVNYEQKYSRINDNTLQQVVKVWTLPQYKYQFYRYLFFQSDRHDDITETDLSSSEEYSRSKPVTEKHAVSDSDVVYKCKEYFTYSKYSYYDLDAKCGPSRLPQPTPK